MAEVLHANLSESEVKGRERHACSTVERPKEREMTDPGEGRHTVQQTRPMDRTLARQGKRRRKQSSQALDSALDSLT